MGNYRKSALCRKEGLSTKSAKAMRYRFWQGMWGVAKYICCCRCHPICPQASWYSIKGTTSRMLQMEYKELKKQFRGQHLGEKVFCSK